MNSHKTPPYPNGEYSDEQTEIARFNMRAISAELRRYEAFLLELGDRKFSGVRDARFWEWVKVQGERKAKMLLKKLKAGERIQIN